MGVLHHTGAMINALQLAAGLVKSGGIFAFALYRKTPLCWAWKVEKQYYARASSKMQSRIARAYVRLMQLRFRLSGMDFANYVQSYSQQWRGMDFERDVHHWLGGYPYESIRPREANALMNQLGFELRFSRIEPFSLGLFSTGCDEYVYSRG
jgi:hypothetical protein